MALLSIEDEMARATLTPPFSNGYEGESWESIWCEDCIHYDDCPLLSVAVFGRTPHAWKMRDIGALNRYTCHEHQAEESV